MGINEASDVTVAVPARRGAQERNEHEAPTVLAGGPQGSADEKTNLVADIEATRMQPLATQPGSTPAPVDTRLQAQLRPGMTLKNRFVIEEVLGVGGMSVVFRARDLRKVEAQDRTPDVAIKVLGPEFKHHPESLKVLQREAKKAQTLAHPNIINVYDFDRDGDTIFMTMEILNGQGLDKIIQANRLGGLPVREVMPIVEGISQALGYAHKKAIIHSDLKPGNVYLTEDKVVKVLDFGIARARHDGEPKNAQEDNFDAGKLGALTPAYASCEMLEGREPDPRDDIYALGCIIYELLTGRHPFGRESALNARNANLQPEPIPGLKRRQWAALRRALAFNRDDRIADVLQFYNEFRPHKVPWRWMGFVSLIGMGLLGGWVYNAYQNKQLTQEIGDTLARVAPVNLTPAQKAKIKELTDVAQLYLSLGQYAAPPGDSAFDAYQKILEIDPRNADARDGERKIAEYYVSEAQAAIEKHDLGQAKAMIDLGLYVRPGDDRLLQLQKKLNNR